jgi:hypothetical protein
MRSNTTFTLSAFSKISRVSMAHPGLEILGRSGTKDHDDREVLAAAVTAYFSDALMTP